MPIDINPNRINNPSGRPQERKRQPERDAPPVVVPKKASENYIPAPESLRTLISSAVTALRQGVRWDRGTILNLVV